MTADIELSDAFGREIQVAICRLSGIGDAQYTQITLDVIAPYLKQLSTLNLNTDDVEQLRPFLNLWLAKGAPGSVTSLDLSANKAALVFPAMSSQLGDRLGQCVRHLESLTLSSVGLEWSTAMFDGLTSMKLANLPSSCCPSLVQLARMLSSCPCLRSLILRHITFPASLGAGPEPAELQYLGYLYLSEVDLQSVLPIISPKRGVLRLKLHNFVDHTKILEPLLSFANRVHMYDLELTLSETRSD